MVYCSPSDCGGRIEWELPSTWPPSTGWPICFSLADTFPGVPRLMSTESLEMFLSQLPERFVSSRGNKDKVREVAEAARAQLSQIPYGQEISFEILESLQQLFSHYPWIGMIVPSMKNMELDRFLASPEFLYDLVHKVKWQDDGLIIQPGISTITRKRCWTSSPISDCVERNDAVAGLLFWRPNEDSVFLPFAGKTPAAVRECAGWALSNLKISRFRGLKTFEAEYFRRFPEARATAASTTTLLHISDLHIGSTEAATSLPRLQQLLRRSNPRDTEWAKGRFGHQRRSDRRSQRRVLQFGATVPRHSAKPHGGTTDPRFGQPRRPNRWLSEREPEKRDQAPDKSRAMVR